MPTNKPDSAVRSIFTVALIILVLYLFASSSGLIGTVSNLVTPCDKAPPLFKDSSQWAIGSSTLPAQMIWQKSETFSRQTVHLGSPNTGFPASNGEVLYWQFGGGAACDTQPIVVALDAATGREVWRYRPDEIITQLFAITDGFILMGVSGITKLDFHGQVLWRQTSKQNIPFRDFSTLYEMNGSLFLPDFSAGKTYEFRSANGELVGSKDSGQVMGMFDDLTLIKAGPSALAILDSNQQPILEFGWPDDQFRNTPLNPIYPAVAKQGNELFLYFDSMSFQARDLSTGKPLWTSEKPMIGIPVLTDGVLIAYGADDHLELYDPQNGDVLGDIALQRSGDKSTETTARFSVWITAYEHTVFIRRLDDLEIMALKLDLSKVHTAG